MKPLALRSILVATDLEDDMVPALRSARQLAELAGADLHVVHAGRAPADHKHLDARIAALRSSAGFDFEVSLLAAPPAAAITQEAARTSADVIVLGHHRNRAGLPGSTADRVVRSASVACLVLPEPLTLPLASVLVPVDIDYAAGPIGVALTWASALRRRPSLQLEANTRVDVLHVHSDADANDELLQARLLDLVNDIKLRVARLALVDIAHEVQRHDDVPAAIVHAAHERNSSLIVLGTRSQRIDSAALGSVSSAVIQRTDRPALLVPPEVWRSAQPAT